MDLIAEILIGLERRRHELCRRHGELFGRQRRAVEALGQFHQRRIAAIPHRVDNGARAFLDHGIEEAGISRKGFGFRGEPGVGVAQ